MNLYPAIDLYEGQVVRLTKGDFAQKTVYSDQPAVIAAGWEAQGARWLHVVDLEGAKSGIPANLPALAAIRKKVRCRIQFGGGVRRLDDIRRLIETGADRVVVGTKALDPDFLDKALQDFGDRLAVGLDVKDGRVQTEGWLAAAGQPLADFVAALNKRPVETVIYTDIHKDGMLAGPNFEQLGKLLDQCRAGVILSGGVAELKDIERCAQLSAPNFEGVIIGKALYEKRFTLKDAFAKVTGKS